jgi:hypothetical protein
MHILFLLAYSFSSLAAFTAKSNLSWVESLAAKSNCIIKNDQLLKEIKGIKSFTHGVATGIKVADDLGKIPAIKISTYKSKNPFSKAIATTYPSDKETIYLNLRSNPRAMDDMVATVCHEATHILNYGHGDNSPVGKYNSVPYKVQSLCKKYYHLCK